MSLRLQPRAFIMTSGAPPEPTTTGYAPNESRRAAALPSRVEEPFARQYAKNSTSSSKDGRPLNLTLTDAMQATTTGQRPVGGFATTGRNQVCQHPPGICSRKHSAIRKLPTASWSERKPQRCDVPTFLVDAATPGARGMVKPASRPVPRDPAAVWLGDLTAVRSVHHGSDTHASRRP